jgi:hypothetical protein
MPILTAVPLVGVFADALALGTPLALVLPVAAGPVVPDVARELALADAPPRRDEILLAYPGKVGMF